MVTDLYGVTASVVVTILFVTTGGSPALLG